jgi:hypothetical protein
MDLQISVDTAGKSTVTVRRATLAGAPLVACIQKVARSGAYPTSVAATTATVLLIFLGGGGQALAPSPAPPATPPETPAPSPAATQNRSYISGQVVDATTGNPIIGALVLLIKPGVRLATLTKETLKQQVSAVAVSASTGYYRTRQPLPRGATYGIVIAAKGYRTVAVDDAVTLKPAAAPMISMGRVKLQPRGY